ncbi:MAG: hypothetical protein F4018_19380 [Acidobacteria bacterium]|nr:hypothetical protein [Acidobacteriota bacterium]MYH27710.1 hypothetical protein [Acidobacteriota bacterium]MYK90327.1 hypothetical protein [Acidobacteriota bacterium]
MLHLLRGPAAGRRVDDAAQPVEGAGGQLLDSQVDIGAADMLVEQRRSLGQLHRVDIALQRADERARGKVGRFRARECLLRVQWPRGAKSRCPGARCGGRAQQAEGFAAGVTAAPDGRIGHGLPPAGGAPG